MQKYINGFIKYQQIKNANLDTLLSYKSTLEEFAKVTGRIRINALNDKDFNKYIDYLSEKNYAVNTCKKRYSVICSYFLWLRSEGHTKIDPSTKFKKIKPLFNPKFLSTEEVKLILNNASNAKGIIGARDYALLELLYSTGIKVSEAQDINCEDLNIEDKELFVQGKGTHERVIPICENAIMAANNYLEKSIFIRTFKRADKKAFFLNTAYKRITSAQINNIVKIRSKFIGRIITVRSYFQ